VLIATLLYYGGFILAIALCRSLGPIFYVPQIANLVFNLSLQTGFLSGWDIRLLMAFYGFAMFVWVMVMAGNFRKSTFMALLLLDLGVAFQGMWVPMRAEGSGQSFWNVASTSILDVWMVSISVVVGSVFFESSVMAHWRGKFADWMTNPKKRFLIPIGAWAGILVAAKYGKPLLPEWFVGLQYIIAALVLVWGWVALELPFYIKYKRLHREVG
jgi:hypothetical protein